MEESKQAVSLRHRREWEIFRKSQLEAAMKDNDYEAARLAKALADVLKVCQEGERRAWGFTDEQEDDGSGLQISWQE